MIVFGDSIIRGIRMRDFNQQLKYGYAKFKSFPGCNSMEMLHETNVDWLVSNITLGSK